ncbi:hypothetical protein ACE193_16565 [Bernardetia sp. OM2101]|uniref:hypothetical protein n=1 Tax=Bernardetia sp. OM2101 TaxID=3344876 RepID=UPI0035CEF1AC
MIVLYILGGIVLFFAIFIPFITAFYHIRYYFLIQKTGVYEVLNEFVNTEEFIQESNYVGGNIKKKRLMPIEIKFDSFFNPSDITMIGISLDSTNEIPIYSLCCSFEKRGNKWFVYEHLELITTMDNIMKEEYGENKEENKL